MENSMGVSQEIKNITTKWGSIPTSGYIAKEIKSLPQRGMRDTTFDAALLIIAKIM